MALSDHVLYAPLRSDGTVTQITVPTGRSRVFFQADQPLFARKGSIDADVPSGTWINDGSASFPFAAGITHDATVAAGERLTFITAGAEGALFLAFQ